MSILVGGSWVKLSIFWIDIHKCRIELQSVFIRNRRVSHCWKLSPIFDVTVILLLYLFFVFASKYSKPLTSFDSFVLSLPLHRQTNWEKILRFHLPHKIGNVLRMIPDLPCKGKYLSLYLYISLNNIFSIQKMNAKRFFLLFIVYSNTCSSTGCNS